MKKRYKEIVEEILLLEPELKSKREDLEKLVLKMIEVQPNVKISKEFRDNLKNTLVSRVNFNKNNYKKVNYIQIIISFFVGGVTAFSIAGLFGVNISIFNNNIDKVQNVQTLSVTPKIARSGLVRTEMMDNFVNEENEEVEDLAFDTEVNDEFETFSDYDQVGISSFGIESFSEESIEINNNLELGNPASVYCEDNGGKLDIIKTEKGDTGICYFDDGSKCEEWEFYNGNCRIGDFLEDEIKEFLKKNNLDESKYNEIKIIIDKYRR